MAEEEAEPAPEPPAAGFVPPQQTPKEAVPSPVSAAQAAEDPVPVPVADTKAGAGVASAGEGYHLTLDEAVELAVQNNLALMQARLSDRLSDVSVREAWAQYYPEFGASMTHSNSRRSGRETGDGATTVSGSVSQRSPWGTSVEFSLSESRSKVDSDTASGGVGLSVRQPLWKGLGTDVGLAGIRSARISRLISRGALDLATQNLIFDVRTAYTVIIRNIQNREVTRQAVTSSRAFLELTRARYKAGQVTQLDVFNAEVQLNSRELDLVRNDTGVEAAFDRLKQLLDLDLQEPLRVDAPVLDFGETPQEGVTKTIASEERAGVVRLESKREGQEQGERKVLFTATRYDESVILKEALDNRIDLLNARRDLALQKLTAMLRKDGLGHQIDLSGSVGRNHAGRTLFEGDNGGEVLEWSAGISASVPWGKISDRAAYERALVGLQRIEIDLKRARTDVQADVRDIMRTLRQLEKAMMISGQLVEQAKRTVTAAKISFDRGLKDSFDVIRAEDGLLAAKRDFVNNSLDYNVQLSRLEVVVGKPTGRVDLSGQSVGGRIETKLPESLQNRPLPKPAPEAEPRPEDDPLNRSREYREDYHPKHKDPAIIERDADD